MMKITSVKFSILCLGIFMFIIFIYFRFIKERIPRDIPFELTTLKLLFLIYICLIFLFLIFKLFKKSQTSSFLHEVIKKIVDFIMSPLKILDDTLKEFIYIKNFNDYFIINFAYKFNVGIIETIYYYYFVVILPRLILLIILFLDIFIHNKLFYIYKIIYLSLILILNKYIIYSLKKTKEELIKSLELYLKEARIGVPFIDILYDQEREDSEKNDPNYDEDSWDYIREVASIINVQFSNFLQYQTTNNNVKLDYLAFYNKTFIIYYTEKNNLVPSENLKKGYREELKTMIKSKIEDILQIALIEHHYNLTVHQNKLVKITFLLIYILYFICWFYILLVSLHTYDIDYEKILKIAIQINYTWTNVENPFLF